MVLILKAKEKMKSTKLKMKLMLSLLMAVLLANCGLNGWPKESNERANGSNLYTPETVTLVEGISYQFKEGVLIGRDGEKYHNDYSYRRAIIIGSYK